MSNGLVATEGLPGAVRALTWLDFGVCVLLANPPAAELFLGLLGMVSLALDLGPVPYPADGNAFFVNLAGLFGVLWNIVMLTSAEPRLHRTDLIARLGVIVLIVYHLAFSGLSPIFLLFVATELAGGAAKLVWLRRGIA